MQEERKKYAEKTTSNPPLGVTRLRTRLWRGRRVTSDERESRCKRAEVRGQKSEGRGQKKKNRRKGNVQRPMAAAFTGYSERIRERAASEEGGDGSSPRRYGPPGAI
jgi:hypothetical protein